MIVCGSLDFVCWVVPTPLFSLAYTISSVPVHVVFIILSSHMTLYVHDCGLKRNGEYFRGAKSSLSNASCHINLHIQGSPEERPGTYQASHAKTH